MTAALLIQGASVEDYAGYTLVASILPILAFLDLGYGGAATNWATEYANTPEPTARLLLQGRLRRALGAAYVPTGVGLILAIASSIWAAMADMRWLHIPISVLSITFAVYVLSIPFAIISKLLIGTGRTTLWIIIQMIQPLVALSFVAITIWLRVTYMIPVAPAVSLLVMCIVGAKFGLASVRIPLSGVLGNRDKRVNNEALFSSAWPMMIILIANPLALSSDRLLLSWFGNTDDVASYSLGAQLFSPALALLSATGLALWPHFAKKRFVGDDTRPWRMVFIFTMVAAIGSAALIALSPWLADLISGNKIQLALVLVICLASSLVVQSAQLPMGMYMMHGSGPKFQAALLVFMFVLKFFLSFVWIPTIGPGGPALATAVAITVCQLVPGAYLIARRVA
ncbi:oligosaccharide flippase family protein [Arthrobacter sp. HS15c]|uniref:oligosaccharide flippase family protein n=1 Tax=Arthrobacter sp. HS15c TaxID=3230279 RepID=UPI003467BDCD